MSWHSRLRTVPAVLLVGLAIALQASPLAALPAPDGPFPPEVRHLVPPPPPRPTLRIVTFNIHHGDDLPALIESLRRHPVLCSADIFLLQEIESYPAEGASRARQLAQALRMNYAYAPARRTRQGGTHGLAILSRYPLSDVRVLPLRQFDLNVHTRRRIALAATAHVGGHPLRLYNLHLDTRLNPQDRLEQLRPVVDAARDHAIAGAVVGGDFNTNPLRWLFHVIPIFRSDQAGAVDDFMRENGFDTPVAHAGSTSRKGLLRFRLDSLYSRGVHVQAFGVERSVEVSDHLPVWMDIRWPPGPTQTR